MKTTLLKSQNFTSSNWSGGSSTQLYIFPENATYAERNFEVRISTATVAIAESTFTLLPGIHRSLMILVGAITITHEGHYSKHLKPFDVDSFNGAWNTSAKGTCTDFNVMTKAGQRSALYHIPLEASSSYTLHPKESCKTLFLYPTFGRVHLQLMDENYTLERGDLLVIENGNITAIAINSIEACGVVLVELY